MIDIPYFIGETVSDIQALFDFSYEHVLRLYYLKLVSDLNEKSGTLADIRNHNEMNKNG